MSASPQHLPRIALTMGDPAGVGPELCLRAFAEPAFQSICTLLVFGEEAILQKASSATGLPMPPAALPYDQWQAQDQPLSTAAVIDCTTLASDGFTPGSIGAATGQAAYTYVSRSIDAALAHQVDAMTTAPLHKEALHLAGISFPGHTEILANRTSSLRSCMMQYSDEITCTFVTTHVGYSEVPALLTVERICDVIDLTVEALRRLRHREPKLVVCGLNPHAGEHGLFGNREEERIILPAIEACRARGVQVEGPLPPDTAFLPARRRCTDAFVCMYHDQGHIPLKALAFDSAVNTTLGLPIIRTSVDHGTALDIAWQGKANPGSLFAALRLAAQLARTER